MEHIMINNKSSKLFLGLVVTLGLASCSMMDMGRSEHVNSHYEPTQNTQQKVVANKPKHKPVQKTYASKDPTQQATPGPVRKAAPQLPVIQ